MRHVDLFSGIGGFALAVDTVWPGSEHIFCDYEPFSQQILKKHWPKSKIYGNIKTFTNTGSDEQRGLSDVPGQEISETWKRCDIITGGFPCQPFSAAGKRKGTEDNRYLWPDMFRVIQEFQPTWVIAENVRGLVTWNEGMVLEQVCTDLESEKYEVQPFIIPAVAVNAPHRRDRIWFIAHRTGEPLDPIIANTQRNRSGKRSRQTKSIGNETAHAKYGSYSYNQNWTKIAAELCGMDDGLSARLDGFELSKSAHRIARLKALGNAIVPQVAIQIMQAIKESERLDHTDP